MEPVELGFWFQWDEDAIYYTLKELEEIDEKIGLANYLWTLKEILEECLAKYQNHQS